MILCRNENSSKGSLLFFPQFRGVVLSLAKNSLFRKMLWIISSSNFGTARKKKKNCEQFVSEMGNNFRCLIFPVQDTTHLLIYLISMFSYHIQAYNVTCDVINNDSDFCLWSAGSLILFLKRREHTVTFVSTFRRLLWHCNVVMLRKSHLQCRGKSQC